MIKYLLAAILSLIPTPVAAGVITFTGQVLPRLELSSNAALVRGSNKKGLVTLEVIDEVVWNKQVDYTDGTRAATATIYIATKANCPYKVCMSRTSFISENLRYKGSFNKLVKIDTPNTTTTLNTLTTGPVTKDSTTIARGTSSEGIPITFTIEPDTLVDGYFESTLELGIFPDR